MKKFGEVRYCPKCRAGRFTYYLTIIGVKEGAQRFKVRYDECDESLKISCHNCGYKWIECCGDAGKARKD